MARFLLGLIAIFSFTTCFSSCRPNELRGEGKKTTSAVPVAAFNAVNIDVTVKTVINMQVGAVPSVQMSGYENVLKHLHATVKNNKLRVYSDLDETWTLDDDDILITITMPSLVELKMSGAPDADIHGNVSGPAFAIDVSGASTIKVDKISVDNFSLDISGAGDVEIKSGTVKNAAFDINGAGDLKAYGLQADEATATISGAGTSELTALKKLTANINGAGTIRYKGHPAVTQDVSGVGSIKDAN